MPHESRLQTSFETLFLVFVILRRTWNRYEEDSYLLTGNSGTIDY